MKDFQRPVSEMFLLTSFSYVVQIMILDFLNLFSIYSVYGIYLILMIIDMYNFGNFLSLWYVIFQKGDLRKSVKCFLDFSNLEDVKRQLSSTVLMHS